MGQQKWHLSVNPVLYFRIRPHIAQQVHLNVQKSIDDPVEVIVGLLSLSTTADLVDDQLKTRLDLID